MNWLKKIFGSDGVSIEVGHSNTSTVRIRGMPVYEGGLQYEKLERRVISIFHDGENEKLPIDVIRGRFKLGSLSGDAPALVTNFDWGETYYCGETNVRNLVAGWETAPLESSDNEDIARMVNEFELPNAGITTKAEYGDLKKFYARCDAYYRHILIHGRQFKRITKTAAKDLVFLLDQTKSGWDATDGEKRFAEEVIIHLPNLVRTEEEKKIRQERAKKQRLVDAEKQPLTDTRNLLTRFPHKDLQVEVRDQGSMEIRAIKEKLREGSVTPQTMVRYRPAEDWLELFEFLDNWVRSKATINQIRYLRSLQSGHRIHEEIPLDMAKDEISAKIDALAER